MSANGPCFGSGEMGGLKSGVSGCVLLLPASFMTLILTILGMANPALVVASPLWYSITEMVASILIVIGILLVSIGAMKLGTYYKNALPKVAGIIGLVAGIIGIVSSILGLIGLFAPVLTGIAGIIGIVMWILMGVFLILLGVAFIVLRGEIGYSGLSLGTGIMSIIAGAMTCSIFISFVGIAILVPTAVCAAYLFTKAKGIPEEEAKKSKKLVVRLAEARAKKPMKPEEIEDEVYKYVRKHPGGIDVAECADSLGISEKDVEKVVNALVKRGKLEIG